MDSCDGIPPSVRQASFHDALVLTEHHFGQRQIVSLKVRIGVTRLLTRLHPHTSAATRIEGN